MKKLGKVLTPGVTLFLFILAGALLLTGSIGGTRAVLNYRSEFYTAQVRMYHIGVTLQENEVPVSWRNYIEDSNGQWDESTGVLLGSDWQKANGIDAEHPIKLGVPYKEEITVANGGAINEYVRVTINKYWADADGNKLPDLDPSLIDLKLVEGNGWTIDHSSHTPERDVLYYSSQLAGRQGDEGGVAGTEPCTSTLTIKKEVATIAHWEDTEDGGKVLVYPYRDKQFVIEATVDAVQNHNEEQAKMSAWGRTGPSE